MAGFQKGLFPHDPFDYTDPQAVENELKAAYPLFWVGVNETWNRLQLRRADDEEFRDMVLGEIGWWMWSRFKRNILALCEEHPDFGCVPSRLHQQQFHVTVNNRVTVVFKKLKWNKHKSRLERSNIYTPTNRDFYDHRPRAGCPDLPRVILGYEPIKELTEILIRVGCPVGYARKFRWVYQMPDQSEAVQELFARKRVDPPTEQERKRGFVVHHRRTDTEEHGTK